MSTMTHTALSDCSYPESTAYNIRDEINANITRLKVVIDEEASLRKTLRALFVKRREDAIEQVRLANIHLDLVNAEEAAFCDDLMQAAASANEGIEGAVRIGSVPAGEIVMPPFFPIPAESLINDPSFNKVSRNAHVASKTLNHRDSYGNTAPPRTPERPTPSFENTAPPKSPAKSTCGLFDEPPRALARSTHTPEPPRSPARSMHAFMEEPTRSLARSPRWFGDEQPRSPVRSIRGLFDEPPRSPVDSTHGFVPCRSPAQYPSELKPLNSPARSSYAPDPIRSPVPSASGLDEKEMYHEDVRSEGNYGPYEYPRPDSRGSENRAENRGDPISRIPTPVPDDGSTREDPVLSSRFRMSTTAASIPPYSRSQRKKSPTEPVPDLKPRQLTDTEMYKLSKVAWHGDIFGLMSSTRK